MATVSPSASTPGSPTRPIPPDAGWEPAGQRPAAEGLRRRAREWTSWALIAPLFLFLVATFLIPVMLMLGRGVSDRELGRAWPETAVALRAWDGDGLPDAAIVPVLSREILQSRRDGTISLVANRLNYDRVGSRSLVYGTADALARGAPAATLADLARLDPRWGEVGTWATLRHAAGPLSSFYLLAALDRRLGPDRSVVRVEREQAVFVDILLRTFKIAAVVALLCALLGYPLAYLLATLPARLANPLMILVLLPFWTSALVRTTAWVVLLQTEGVLNNLLVSLGLVEAPLALVYNRLGVYIAMTHVLLPFLVLPLYGVMKGIPAAEMRAASSLGAGPTRAFLRIWFPQTVPGLAAGMVIVFTLALGYYITPALVGGGGDQMLSGSIAFYTSQSLNWGMAAALSLLLLLPLALMLFAGRYLTRTVPA